MLKKHSYKLLILVAFAVFSSCTGTYNGQLLGELDRPDWIDVEYMDEYGTVKEGRLEGVSAQCFLHELDHLNGIKFISYAKPVALQMARKKQKKTIKTIVRKAKKS